MAKTVIHVNQHKIKSNRKSGQREAVLTVKTSKKNIYTNSVAIVVPDVGVVARVHYSPDKPLSCGATCWVETEYEVVAERPTDANGLRILTDEDRAKIHRMGETK